MPEEESSSSDGTADSVEGPAGGVETGVVGTGGVAGKTGTPERIRSTSRARQA